MMQTDFRLADALGNDSGDKRLDILRRIGTTGSISSAARAAGVSYKAAWQAIDTLANLAGTPLVDTAVGGSGGGGARLTAAGERLIAVAERLQAARAAVFAELATEAAADTAGMVAPTRRGITTGLGETASMGNTTGTDGTSGTTGAGIGTGTGIGTATGAGSGGAGPAGPEGGPVASPPAASGGPYRSRARLATGLDPDTSPSRFGALALRTSLRNQLPGLIGALERDGSRVRVVVDLGGTDVAARITIESTELLGLRVGLPVLVLFKATAVMIAARLDARAGLNCLGGTVARLSRSAGGSAEIALALPSGLRIVGFAAAGHRLRSGRPAMAAIDETGVVIALGAD